ncbi:MAG: group II intron reverse transcriptase domain-containing protein [Candidatus Pacebacteria bacterium]|jgi:retron-type reverse transcriptase|nr:group II intron reverse transcriptase domain-containing protein [Candidatus Paceibacterota bacterium]
MSRSQFVHTYDSIISVENLLLAWNEFIKGKKNRKDAQVFQLRLIDNILSLHLELKNKTYVHRGYEAFKISDPKPRDIHKASVRDRLLHRAIYRKLYPFFDRTFIPDSFSCRLNKGTHKAFNRFTDFHRKVSKNNTKTIWVLKCDIRKFFASVGHDILIGILKVYISDPNIVQLLNQIINSFPVGLPLGNLTSQLFVNIYMNEFDQFVKHKLKAKYYIRYADDFVILSESESYLENILNRIREFLLERLKLSLHPNKVSIKTLASGVGYLGWIHFPDHRVLRTATKRRMLKNISDKNRSSYAGLLKHGHSRRLTALISTGFNQA